MNGTRARSAGVKRATPSPPEREVPKSWVKRGTSSGDKMEKVYDIVRWFRVRGASRDFEGLLFWAGPSIEAFRPVQYRSGVRC